MTNINSKPRGYILFEDTERIVIATMETENPKTGDMVQIWILVKSESPTEAVKSGNDEIVCGDCPLRGTAGRKRACYVQVFQAPLSVWNGWNRGIYPFLPESEYPAVFNDRAIRFGAYGDPVYLPIQVIRLITRAAGRNKKTGYTHQWRNPAYQAYRRYLMASCETEMDRTLANSLGWRTFRTRPTIDAPIMAGEIICPASDEGNHRSQCVRCGLCNGRTTDNDVRKDIVIVPHGSGAKNLIQLQVAQHNARLEFAHASGWNPAALTRLEMT